MRRRDFIKVVGGSAVTWPLAARAQQQHPMPVKAFLKSTTPDDSAHLVRAFRQGLSEAGFVEGRNVTIEYRWAENQLDRLPELVAELVRRRVAGIATPADTPATLWPRRDRMKRREFITLVGGAAAWPMSKSETGSRA